MPKALKLEGNKYGKLTVLERAETPPGNGTFWVCMCECGETTTVPAGSLRKGRTTSCGCVGKNTNRKHGMYETRLYRIWRNMLSRCYNANNISFKYYGGKGIKVCEDWKNFQSFASWASDTGYNDKLTLDRKRNENGYNPNNCRWATRKQQANNRTVSVKVTAFGDVMTVEEASIKFSVNPSGLYKRLKAGKTESELIYGSRGFPKRKKA